MKVGAGMSPWTCRSLKLSGVEEYRKWTKGKLKNKPNYPDDIPAWPHGIYGRKKGWQGMTDFLGSKPSAKYVQMWPFPKALSSFPVN